MAKKNELWKNDGCKDNYCKNFPDAGICKDQDEPTPIPDLEEPLMSSSAPDENELPEILMARRLPKPHSPDGNDSDPCKNVIINDLRLLLGMLGLGGAGAGLWWFLH